jgi:predicted nuclease of predicted toxin-antitoxin system
VPRHPATARCRQTRFVPGTLAADAVRFHCDQNVATRVVVLLRACGVSFSTASETGLAGVADVDQLAYAAAHGRVLITNDVKADFVALAGSVPHVGVLLCNGEGRFPRDVFRRCLGLWAAAGEAGLVSPDTPGRGATARAGSRQCPAG